MAGFAIGDRHPASAGFGHRPRFQQGKAEAFFKDRVMPPVNACAEAEPHAVVLVARVGRRAKQHRRHHAKIVNDGGATVPHAVPPGAG